MGPSKNLVESIPKILEQIPVTKESSTSKNFDYDEEEYIYYDEWIPIKAENEISNI